MEITWFGHSCFRIKGNKTTIITDPYSKEVGEMPPKLTADIMTVSHKDSGLDNIKAISGNVHPITGPGEYEIGGVLIIGIATSRGGAEGGEGGKNTVYLMEVDEISILHCGELGQMLSAAAIEEIGNVDILIVPVGDKTAMGATTAAELVRRLEPKIVIPMEYPIKNIDAGLDPVDRFLKEMGGKEVAPQPKLAVTQSKLPLTTQVILLDV